MQKITTCLWFDKEAEEAVNFYTSIFKDSKIGKVSRYGESGPGETGSVMVIMFELEGREFMALNACPHVTFNEAVSMVVNCETQEEIDYYWDRLLSDGGKESQCGWLKDKYGLSWQIVPSILDELLGNDSQSSERVMKAVMQMVKLDIKTMKDAFDGKLIG